MSAHIFLIPIRCRAFRDVKNYEWLRCEAKGVIWDLLSRGVNPNGRTATFLVLLGVSKILI
jgi:hypothetical protein